jgi:sugar phosphate isomerase/epimerase
LHGSAIFQHGDPAAIQRDACDRFSDSLIQLEPYARDRGVSIWIENLERYSAWHPFHTVFSGADDYRQVFDAVPSVKMTLDIGHENVSSGDPVSVFREFHERIVALDFNDNDGHVDTHSPLGEGCVPLEQLVESIRECSWHGHVTFEIRGGSAQDAVAYLAAL